MSVTTIQLARRRAQTVLRAALAVLADAPGVEQIPFPGDRLLIGKFCAIARDVIFIMNGANHWMSNFSTYPFQILGNGWEKVMPQTGEFPYKGDTIVGNDVWIGYGCLIMSGVRIGNGAMISSRFVATADVPPCTLVGGSPAKPPQALVRERHAMARRRRLAG